MTMNTKQRGFTLTELLITVAIVGILAAITYPSYIDHINKSKRAEAKAALASLANAMETWRMQNSSYLGAAGTQATPTNTGSPWVFSAVIPVSGGTKTYDLTISAMDATGTSYTLSATPITGSSDICGTLTLTNTGTKTPATNCW